MSEAFKIKSLVTFLAIGIGSALIGYGAEDARVACVFGGVGVIIYGLTVMFSLGGDK